MSIMEKGCANQNQIKIQEIVSLIKNQYAANFTSKFLDELSEDNLSILNPKIISRGCENAYNIIKKKFNGERDQIADQTSKAALHLMQKELVCFF